MKIALVSDWYYPKIGGVARHMHDLAIKLNERGHEVAIITNDRETGKEKELETLGIDLIKVPGKVSPVLDINLSYGIKSEKEFEKYIEGFDVVHAHHAFTPLSLKAMKAAKNMDIGCVLTTHSISVMYDLKLWKMINGAMPVVKQSIACADRIIAVSEASKKFISHFVDEDKVIVVPNGVDVERFVPPADKNDAKRSFGFDGKKVVLYLSRLSIRKGPHVLVSATALIKDDVETVIAGDGKLLHVLKTQAKLLGVSQRIRFISEVSDDKVPLLFQAADVFVLPSITAEAFGIVLLEAMASCVPVISTKIGGIPEIINESKAGLLVEPMDETELAEAISRLLQDDELRKNMGENGREYVVKNYSWLRIVPMIEDIYREVIRF